MEMYGAPETWGDALADDAELDAFVREHVRSVWALELLLTLRRDPARRWTADELVSELRASAGLVAENLLGLQRAGVVAPDEAGRHRYAPANPAVEALCGELAEAYRQRPVAVISMISRPRDPLQSLADAFKFRGEPK